MITIKSHGFKFSRPEANIVFDVSYFKNPWRETGIMEEKDAVVRRKMIIEFMIKQKGAYELVENILKLIDTYNLLFPDENIVIAICCSAGEYRSPAFVEIINKLLPPAIGRIIKHNENSKL